MLTFDRREERLSRFLAGYLLAWLRYPQLYLSYTCTGVCGIWIPEVWFSPVVLDAGRL